MPGAEWVTANQHGHPCRTEPAADSLGGASNILSGMLEDSHGDTG